MSEVQGVMMTEYQSKVSVCIDEKLIDFAMHEAKSLYNIDILYHYHLQETMKLFDNPLIHYTKIMKIAYDKTIKEMME